ncbi:MAG: NAD(P)/FAD-dependent oxidoreductase [Acidimicrobiia bacterium]
MSEYDAVVVGSGPNGLMAAITMARAGRRTVVLEAAPAPGGGSRSAALTEPGFVHDVCSSVHPTAVASPAFATVPLAARGVEWCHPEIALAHPLAGGRAGLVHRSVDDTARGLGSDADAYRSLMGRYVAKATQVSETLFSPLGIPRVPFTMARFGLDAIRSVQGLTTRRFDGDEARAILAGSAAHSMVALDAPGSAGYGMFLTLLAHAVGWPVAAGGSQRIADALVAELAAHGGEVVTDHEVTSLSDLPPARSVLLDITPRQLLALGGDRVPTRYRRTLRRYRYGPGVFKIDWALSGPVPWTNPDVGRAATVHVGGTIDEIAASEAEVLAGRVPTRPFVIFVQAAVADPSRAPAGRHTGWAYCHVPNGSTIDCTEAIEAQVERFAPGFRDTILARHTMHAAGMEAYDANYVGGDINGGAGTVRQIFTRPAVSPRPWVTPIPRTYLCSSATPPGGGVHGMCGWHAARAALRRDD